MQLPSSEAGPYSHISHSSEWDRVLDSTLHCMPQGRVRSGGGKREGSGGVGDGEEEMWRVRKTKKKEEIHEGKKVRDCCEGGRGGGRGGVSGKPPYLDTTGTQQADGN